MKERTGPLMVVAVVAALWFSSPSDATAQGWGCIATMNFGPSLTYNSQTAIVQTSATADVNWWDEWCGSYFTSANYEMSVCVDLHAPHGLWGDCNWNYNSSVSVTVEVNAGEGGFGTYTSEAIGNLDYFDWQSYTWQHEDTGWVWSPTYVSPTGPGSMYLNPDGGNASQYSTLWVYAESVPIGLIPYIDWSGCTPLAGNNACAVNTNLITQVTVTASLGSGDLVRSETYNIVP